MARDVRPDHKRGPETGKYRVSDAYDAACGAPRGERVDRKSCASQSVTDSVRLAALRTPS